VTRRNTKPRLFEKIARDLTDLGDEASRARYVARRCRFHRSRTVHQLIDASRTNLRIEPHQALSLADAAVAIAGRLRNKDDLGTSLRAKANALYTLGDNQGALGCHSRALLIFRATRNAEQQARTLSSSIQPLILLGAYPQAVEAAKSARKIFHRLGDRRHLAHLEINNGNIYHRQDRFEEGLACYERAYGMLIPLRDSEGLAVALYNISVCLIGLNDFPRALATYKRAREMCVRRGMTLLVGQADYNVAYLYYLRGEYGRAIDMLCATRELCEKNGDAHILALCYLDLSDVYLELNLAAEAAETAEEGFIRFQKLGMGYEKAKCLTNKALALGQRGKAAASLKLFAQARSVFVREKNRVWPRLIDLYRALSFLNEGRLLEARRSCEKAFEFFRSSPSSGKAVLCSLLLARIEIEAGNPTNAQKYSEEALHRLSKMELPALHYQANLLMGQAHHAARNAEVAYSFYQKARKALEALRSRLRKDEMKIAFMKNKFEVYECLVELCLDGGLNASPPHEEAFEYIEAAKSRSLMELMFQGTQKTPEGIASQSESVQRIRNLREELNWYYHRIEQEQLRPEEGSPARIDSLQNEAKARENDLLRAVRELPDSEPDATLLRGFSGIALQEIQSSLPQDTLVIEYFAVRDRLIVALIARDRFEIVSIASLARVGNLLEMLRFQLSKLCLGPDYARRFEAILLRATRNHLRDLYRELLEPIGDRLQQKHLIFIPHGILHFLPFHALFDGQQYLIDRFSVSYSPSASIYHLCQNRPSPPGDTSLVLGVPDAQAPSISDEISAVASQVKFPEVFSGRSATEQVLREKGPNSRLVHIATHGNFRQDNPMFSHIRLGGSHLSVLDLYHLRLPADLVTLSGCATGLNVVVACDEPLGLMRGLLSAGARSLLLTLWDVHDRSTTEFMTAFYGHLQAGKTKAQALRVAVQKTRDLYPHPYYWAPFFLVGAALGGQSE
jgi:CHAT domain-containing protein